jgi:hypothetical protein
MLTLYVRLIANMYPSDSSFRHRPSSFAPLSPLLTDRSSHIRHLFYFFAISRSYIVFESLLDSCSLSEAIIS